MSITAHYADKQGAFSLALGKYATQVDAALEKLASDKVLPRIWEIDHTVWKDKPDEISNRLGWLRITDMIRDNLKGLLAFVDEVRSAGFDKALLLGMGGSSLAPEVFRFTFGLKKGYPDLAVLDSTDPGAVLDRQLWADQGKTLFIVATKSGGTVETLSFMKHFYTRALDALGQEEAGSRFVAITDPGSKLESMAKDLGFRRTFLNDPNIGGRFSALSFFGMVPAALSGVDLEHLLQAAEAMMDACGGQGETSLEHNSGAILGAILGVLANQGRDKVTLLASPALRFFGAWAEQLIAESTGKEGKGILPVDLEEAAGPEQYGQDRLFVQLSLNGEGGPQAAVDKLEAAGHPVVRIRLDDIHQLGAEMFRWEMATAVASRFLGINPFDQPNVESAKVSARKAVAAYQEQGALPVLEPALEQDGIKVYADFKPSDLKDALAQFLARGKKDSSYVCLQAYLHPTDKAWNALQQLRHRIRERTGFATSNGFGPRFLHSTGQLHKGDGGNGLFLQFTAAADKDIPVPDQAGSQQSSISFEVLRNAQALGDRNALLDAERQLLGFDLGSDAVSALKKLAVLV